jgi:hypothetical protein
MASDRLIAPDAVIRQAAFDHVRALQSRDLVLGYEDIARGFMFEGQRWPLWNPQRGIFKPRGMPFLLSIRTVFPRKGGRIWYDDQRRVHQQIFAGEEELAEARTTFGSVRLPSARSSSFTSSASPPGGTRLSSRLSWWTGTRGA